MKGHTTVTDMNARIRAASQTQQQNAADLIRRMFPEPDPEPDDSGTVDPADAA